MKTFTHTLADELRQAAAQTPDRPFIRMLQGEWTFARVDLDSDHIALALHDLGVSHRHNVSLLLPNCIEFALSWFGLAKLGAVAAPVNTAFRGVVLANAVNLVQSRVLIVHAALLPQLVEVKGQLTTVTQLIVVGDAPVPDALSWATLLRTPLRPLPPPPSHFSDLSLLLYTSGTTGRSKAAMLSNRFVLRHGQGVIDGLGLRADDVLYCPYPMFHMDSAIMTIAPALLLRAVAAIGERFSVSRYWDEMRLLQATVFDFMGATLTMLWKQPASVADRAHRARLGWGVPLPDWAGDFEARFGCRLVELYGSTEVGTFIFTPQDAPRRVGSCGKPLGPFEVQLLDEEGFEVPFNTAGELVVRGLEPCVLTDGYWAMPEATLTIFRNQWFHTGDMLRQDADGWLYFIGRRKDMVRRRGENISAAEVEIIVDTHPEVLECAVFGVPSNMTEEDVMVCAVLRTGSALTAQALTDWCTSRMARFMLPRYVRFMPVLPKTPTDKVEKFRLQHEGSAGAWDREAASNTPSINT